MHFVYDKKVFFGPCKFITKNVKKAIMKANNEKEPLPTKK